MIKKIRYEKQRFQKELKEKTIAYIAAALGLVASLAWNEAIKDLIEYLFPLTKNTLMVKFIYAGLLTLIIVVILNSLIKFAKKI